MSIAASMTLNGTAIDPAATYRVTVNNYLALGGDGFVALKDGRDAQFGAYDNDALFGCFGAHSPIAPAPPTRITRTN